jgi:hypothetical protein
LSIELVENHTGERTSKNRPTLIQPNRKDECCNQAGIQIQKDEILLQLINTQFDLLLKEKLSRQGLKSGSSDPRVKKSSATKENRSQQPAPVQWPHAGTEERPDLCSRTQKPREKEETSKRWQL